jgi:hypothetical protein
VSPEIGVKLLVVVVPLTTNPVATTLTAGAAKIVSELLVADVYVPLAVRTSPVPAVLTLHPAKVATPELDVTLLLVHVSVPDPVESVSVIEVAATVVTVFP